MVHVPTCWPPLAVMGFSLVPFHVVCAEMGRACLGSSPVADVPQLCPWPPGVRGGPSSHGTPISKGAARSL